MRLVLSQQPAADALLSRDPLALLIGMVLDQQVPLERAFSAPYDLTQRLGHDLNAAELADYDLDALADVFARPPALHRYPRSMAKRVQDLCRLLVDRYGGDAAAVWRDVADGEALRRRIAQLPGFGAQKAQIFVALLGKQGEAQPAGWREAAGPYGEHGSHRSVADITDDESLRRVREYKQQLKTAAKPTATPASPKRAGAGTGKAAVKRSEAGTGKAAVKRAGTATGKAVSKRAGTASAPATAKSSATPAAKTTARSRRS